jgi:hypothetical protein
MRRLPLFASLLSLAAWADSSTEISVDQRPPAYEVHATAESGVQSTYVFRGVPMYTRTASPSSQTTLSLGVDGVGPGTFSVSLWNATALVEHTLQRGNQLELDVSAAYGFKLSVFDLSVGYTGYLYPEATVVDQAHELNLGFAWSNEVLTPFVSFNAELVRLHGVYAAAGGFHDFVFGTVTVTPKASLAVMGYAATPTTLSDLQASVNVKWAIAGPVYALANVSAAERLNRPGSSLSDNTVVWGGVSLGISR